MAGFQAFGLNCSLDHWKSRAVCLVAIAEWLTYRQGHCFAAMVEMSHLLPVYTSKAAFLKHILLTELERARYSQQCFFFILWHLLNKSRVMGQSEITVICTLCSDGPVGGLLASITLWCWRRNGWVLTALLDFGATESDLNRTLTPK